MYSALKALHYFCKSCIAKTLKYMLGSNKSLSTWLPCVSRLTGSELHGQEEPACTCPAKATTSMLFTAINTVKFPSAITRLSWALPLSYYRAT